MRSEFWEAWALVRNSEDLYLSPLQAVADLAVEAGLSVEAVGRRLGGLAIGSL